jgi:prepilin-type N-terminal cleavage/methylation domain-containing protein
MPPARTLPRTPARRRAFTLIELIVVVVILAVLAAAVVPRLGSTVRQEASAAVDQAAELVRLFAYRQALGSQQVALWRDGADGRIHLIVKDVDPADPASEPEWRADRFAAPVALPPGLELADARADGKSLDASEWTISSIPGGERPKVELRFVGHGLDASVVLPTGSQTVFRLDADQPERVARDVVDLDQSGRSREPW